MAPITVYVTSRSVNIKKAELNPYLEVLSRFQIREYVSDWARKKFGIEGRQLPFYRLVVRDIQGQQIQLFQFPRFCLGDLMRHLSIDTTNLVYLASHSPPGGPAMRLAPTFTQTPLQKQVTDYVMKNHLGHPTERDRGRASCIIALDTGVGKTFVAAHLIATLGVRCLYVTLNHELVKQAVDDLSRCFDPTVTTIGTTLNDSESHPSIVVMNIDAAVKLTPKQMVGIGFMVLDEVPSLCTESRRDIFWLKAPYTVGLTAEPESRRDGLYQFAFKHLGAVVDETKYDAPAPTPFYLRLYEKFVSLQRDALKTHTNAHAVASFLLTVSRALVLNDAYNEAVVDISMALLARDRKHFIFAHHVDHIHTLSSMLVARGVDRQRILAGGLTSDCGDSPSVILATYSMGSVGISVVDATAMILAAPPYSTSFKQLTGRIKRLNRERPEMDTVEREVWMVKTQHSLFQGAYIRLREYLAPPAVPIVDPCVWSTPDPKGPN